MLCKTEFKGFEEVHPLENYMVRTEYWLFLRHSFESFLKRIVIDVKKVNPDMKFGYAKLMGRRNPTCDDATLKFMDFNCQNLYWHWYRSTTRFSIKLDELAGNSPDKPVYLTEFGLRNMFDKEGELISERQYKQLLPIIFMRPQIQGAYIFTYAGQNDYSHQVNNKPGDNPEFSWGMVWPDRTKRRCFYAVSECFQMFKKIDAEIPNLTVQPLAAMTNQLFDELITGKYTCEVIARALYANGVPLHCIPSDDVNAIMEASEPLILTDKILYQDPCGENDELTALSEYLVSKDENRILFLGHGKPKPMYGVEKISLSEQKGYEGRDIFLLDPEEVWKTLAPFIHRDFLIGENSGNLPGDRMRILNSFAGSSTWDIQQSLMFSGDNVYLVIVNTGETVIEKVELLLGVSKCFNLKLTKNVMFAGNEVKVEKCTCNIPEWITKEPCNARFFSISVKNLDTYAVIYLGKIA